MWKKEVTAPPRRTVGTQREGWIETSKSTDYNQVMNEAAYISTAQAARALGVGVTTVKRWVDEGILPAHKTVGGHRKLLVGDVLRLRRGNGTLPLNHSLDYDLAAISCRDVEERASALARLLVKGESEQAQSLILQAWRSGTAISELADQLIAPALRLIGHAWESGRVDVFHEHRGTQICAAALYRLKSLLETQSGGDKPLAVGGAPEKDPYFLANLLAELVLLEAGWRVVNLGPDTPLASFRRAIVELHPRMLWISITHLAEPERFIADYGRFYEEARAANVAVALGGRGLAPEIRARLPYSTFGDGLTHLSEFARTLHPHPHPRRPGRPAQRGVCGGELSVEH